MQGLASGSRLPIFPLPGALLLPRAYLPLHIFEPRYKAMVSDALIRDRRIAMIQPRPNQAGDPARPELFGVGCVGKILEVEALDDGCFNLILEGQSRFRLRRELDATTPFRQVEADFDGFEEDQEGDELVLASIARADIEHEARRFAAIQGFAIDWDQVTQLDDETLVNGLAQAIPFDVASKQALLEAPTLNERADLLATLLRIAGRGETLQ